MYMCISCAICYIHCTLFFLHRQRSPPHEGVVYLISPADSTIAEAQKDVAAKRAMVSTTNPFTIPDDMEGLGNPDDIEMMALSSPKTWVGDDVLCTLKFTVNGVNYEKESHNIVTGVLIVQKLFRAQIFLT